MNEVREGRLYSRALEGLVISSVDPLGSANRVLFRTRGLRH
jgi:hypothetical protein